MRTVRWAGSIAGASLALLLVAAQVAPPNPLRGFPVSEWRAQHELEQKAAAIPDSARIGAYLKRMAAKPHHAGSPGSKEIAEYIAGLLREWGFDAQIEPTEALLPYPTRRVLEMVAPKRYRASLTEPAIPEDPDSAHPNQLPPYNAYSAAGDVTAPLVYVNYGLPEDYQVLKSMGIDVKGKIVIARYGASWRGIKPKVAYENGAVGCIIYSDPRDDGYFHGDVYPDGPYRPPRGVQRGSVMDMAVQVGDPLTPGWGSERGGRRLPLKEATTLMKIPVLPISYADAQPLLQSLKGPVAPEKWRGALPITYRLGPGPATVRLSLDFDWSTRPVYNVIATIPGSTYPDEWILYGNHHDAWVNGANDPVSGAASLLETARTLAELRKQGWTPKRTIKLAFWDAEEFGLIGSTEWVEKHRDELMQKAVAYLNTDSNGKGRFGASGSAMLQQFLKEVIRDVEDPEASGKTILDTVRDQEGRRTEFRLGPLGAGSDYVAFAHHTGIASLNLGFGSTASGGIYHSTYDSVRWYTLYSDGDFRYGKSLSRITTRALLRLADAPVLPFELIGFVSTVDGYVQELKKLSQAYGGKLDLSQIVVELARLEASAKAYEAALVSWTQNPAALSSERAKQLNRLLFQTERLLTLEEGLPGRPWYKHQITAPGLYTGYGAKTLPGIREAAEAERWEEANAQAARVVKVLQAVDSQMRAATDLLR